MQNKKLTTNNDYREYLEKINFSKRLKKLTKKLQGKKVIIYGAGLFFQAICKNYDLSGLNIIAISDKRFYDHLEGEEFIGYKICSPAEIEDLEPDIVLVGTIRFIDIIDELEEYTLEGTGIKVRPLIKKPFVELWKEIWR